MIADSQTARALLEYICQHPADDVPRLVYADWLDDHDEEERAEFIRCQLDLASLPPCPCDETEPRGQQETGWPCRCDFCTLRRRERELLDNLRPALVASLPDGWGVTLADPLITTYLESCGYVIFRRGFPAEIRCATAAFAGGPCGRCRGEKVVATFSSPQFGEQMAHETCPACGGTGRTPGHAAALFRAAPIEAVKLSDREPFQDGPHAFVWLRSPPENEHRARVPSELFDLLGTPQPPRRDTIEFRTRQLAHDALATAALLLGRRRGWPCPRCKPGDMTEAIDRARRGFTPDCRECHNTRHTVSI